MGNPTSCLVRGPVNLKKVDVEEGWIEIIVESRKKERKEREKELQKKRNEITTKLNNGGWVHNANFNTLNARSTSDGVQDQDLFLELFRMCIGENYKKLTDTRYVTTLMAQTRCFENQESEKDLDSQEISAAGSPVFFPILGKLWDRYVTEAFEFTRPQFYSLMRGYFSTFRRVGRLVIAEGIAVGSAFAAVELCGKSQDFNVRARQIQVRLRKQNAAAVELVYNEFLSLDNRGNIDSIFWRLVSALPASSIGLPGKPHGHIPRQHFQKSFMSNLAFVLNIRRIESNLKLPNPYIACAREEKRRISLERDWLEAAKDLEKDS
ncbi:hypothetical protein AAMO2058_001438400 [Amorphochlora amoebiformis]